MKHKYLSLIIIALCMVAFTACNKSVEVPEKVGWADVQALMMEDPVNSEKVAAYTEVWQKNLDVEVEKLRSQNDETAKNDLKDLLNKSKDILSKLEALASLTEGETHVSLNSSALKVKSTLEKIERDLAVTAAPAETEKSAPQQVGMDSGGYHMSFSDGTYFVQTGSYPTLAEAKRHSYSYIMKANIPGKGVFYRTLDGPYSSKQEAIESSCDPDMNAPKTLIASWGTLRQHYVCFVN